LPGSFISGWHRSHVKDPWADVRSLFMSTNQGEEVSGSWDHAGRTCIDRIKKAVTVRYSKVWESLARFVVPGRQKNVRNRSNVYSY